MSEEEMPQYEIFSYGPTRGVVIVTTSDGSSKTVGNAIADALRDEGVERVEVVPGLDKVNRRRADDESMKFMQRHADMSKIPAWILNQNALALLIDVGERPGAPTQMTVQRLGPVHQ